MRYKEFEEKIEEWGEKYGYETEVEIGFYLVDVKIKSGVAFQMMAKIRTDSNRALDTDWESFANIKEDARAELFSIILKLAQTPIEDREDEEENIDSIINRLEVIQTNAEDVMNWTLEEIQERSWNLRNNLDDIIIDLEEYKTFDSIINRLEVIQTNAEDVMNWTILEIQERSWNLRNSLEEIIIDLEEYKEKQELPYEITDMQGMFSINNTDIPL